MERDYTTPPDPGNGVTADPCHDYAREVDPAYLATVWGRRGADGSVFLTDDELDHLNADLWVEGVGRG